MVNPNSGHTAAGNTLGVDGLRDGDVITSPTYTNLVEGVHGNGIIRLQDTSYEMASRNVVNASPGSMVKAAANTLTVSGGYCVLDGVLYKFANGPGNTATVVLDNTLAYVNSTILSAGQESLYTIYVIASSTSPGHALTRIRVAGGTPTTSSTGVYPPTPTSMLSDPIPGYAEENGHCIILATVRCIHNAGGGNDQCDIVEINDKRVYLSTNPKYMTPLTRGSTGASDNSVARTNNTGINTDAQLKDIYGAANVENGDFGGQVGANRIDVSALWVSHQNWDAAGAAAPGSGDPDYGHGPASGIDGSGTNTPTDVLYFSGQANANQSSATGGAMFTTRIGSRGVDVSTWTKGSAGSVNWPITANGDSIFYLNIATAGSTLNLTPTGAFPEGHMVHVNKSGGGGALQFNSVAVAAYSVFVFDGAAWHKIN